MSCFRVAFLYVKRRIRIGHQNREWLVEDRRAVKFRGIFYSAVFIKKGEKNRRGKNEKKKLDRGVL